MKKTPKVVYVQNDLPQDFILKSDCVALDCEMTGLSFVTDKLCTIQLWDGKGAIYIVQFSKGYAAPRLKKILQDEAITKIFHYGRKDLSFISKFLCPVKGHVFDTKLAYRILFPHDEIKASLKELVKKYVGIELAKTSQLSDWTLFPLTQEQLIYASEDVLYLHTIMKKQVAELKKMKRWDLAQKAFSFYPDLAEIDCLYGDEFHRLFTYS